MNSGANQSEIEWGPDIELTRPAMLIAFAGMFDAGEASTEAVSHLQRRWPSKTVASIDPETYFDFTQQRPDIRTDDNGERELWWPENNCVAVRPTLTGDGPRDLLLLSGIEPHLRWRSFADNVLEIARRCDVDLIITLGAAPGRQPHNRPFTITASSSNKELAQRLGVGLPSYQGPTGLVGVLNDRLHAAGLPIIAVRTAVPPYVLGAPNPKGVQALLRHLGNLLSIDTGHEDLHGRALDWETQVSAAVEGDTDAQRFFAQLLSDFDEDEAQMSEDEVDPAALADEVESFLRSLGHDD